MALGDAERAQQSLAGTGSTESGLGLLWQDEQVGPSVHVWLTELGLSRCIDGLSEAVVLAASVEQWQRSERWSRELLRLVPYLEEAGVDATVLKGLGLAILDYGGADHRAFGDLDLLVRPGQFDLASRALKDAGYRPVSMAPRVAGDGEEKDLHHRIFERAPFAIDLHHRVRAHRSFHLSEDVGHRDRRRFSVLGHDFWAPSRGDQLLAIVLGMHVDIGLGSCRWKAVVDCLRLIGTMPEAEVAEFLDERTSDGTSRIAVNVLSLCAGMSSTPVTRLEEALAPHRGLVVRPPHGDAVALLRGHSRLRAKSWALKLYEQSRMTAWWTWLRTVPKQAWANRRSGRLRPSGGADEVV